MNDESLTGSQSDEKTLTTAYSILGKNITVTIYRREKLNKTGQFLALNHDGVKLKRYLKQCIELDELEPHEGRLDDGLRFSIDTVENA